MEVAQVRGAVARELHGAFAEWEAQAHTLTRCSNYLYSLSINPDQRQGRLTKEQYLDYIDRAENRLGLAGQPRAVVFHIKKDKNGVPREHCHVVWSRIDAERGKARVAMKNVDFTNARQPLVLELPVRLDHRVRVDGQVAGDILDRRQAVALAQVTQQERLPDLVDELQVRRNARGAVQAEAEHLPSFTPLL